MVEYDDFQDGYLERCPDGTYKGRISVDGVNIPSIIGHYFSKDGDVYLWLRRSRILEYDDREMVYKERNAQPRFEAYLKKMVEENAVAFKGVFAFLRFRYSVTGVWDRVLGSDRRRRLNLYVEKLPDNEQTIINGIKERKRNENRE